MKAPLLPHALLGIVCTSALVCAPLLGCKQTEEKASPQGAELSQEVTAKARVQSVDKQRRALTLGLQDGSTVVVLAGPEVRNFDSIQAGDTLKVRYRESIAATLMKPEQAGAPDSATLAAGAAGPGEKPAGAIGAQIQVTVRIESVDKENNLVTFTGEDGALRTVRVVRPEGREFIRGLKPGDRVSITYTEALALSVEKE